MAAPLHNVALGVPPRGPVASLGSFMNAAPVTPSDTTVLAPYAVALYTGAGGDITVLLPGDDTPVLFKSTPAGVVLPVLARKVMAAGTAATNIVALW